jgi:ankyrin repeat protein
MRVDATVLAELKGIAELDDISQVKIRLEAVVSALEESRHSSGSTTVSAPSVVDIMIPSDLARELHDVLEQSNTSGLEGIINEVKSVASVVLDGATGVTVLHRAVELGNQQIVEMLLTQVDSEVRAARFLHNLSGEMLLGDQKSRINAKTKLTGYSPLHFAVSGASDRVVVELLKRGADPDQRSTDEQAVSPFLLACELGQEMAVKLMIKGTQGKCIDSTDADGNTALHLAAENGHAGIVEVLMNVLPQLEREENQDGKTAAILATECNRPDIANMIEEMAHGGAEESNEPGGFFFG